MVPMEGLEPPRLAALVPKTSASTNSATWACGVVHLTGEGMALNPLPALYLQNIAEHAWTAGKRWPIDRRFRQD